MIISIVPVTVFGVIVTKLSISFATLDEIGKTVSWTSQLQTDDGSVIAPKSWSLVGVDFDSYYNSDSSPTLLQQTLSGLGVQQAQ